MSADDRVMRSMLFAPANRGEYVRKLAATGADAGILDLEDGLPPSEKAAGRAAVRSLLPECAAAAPGFRFFVRVNAPSTPWWRDDLDAVLVPELAGIVIPKVETPEPVAEVAALLTARGLDGVEILAGIETVAGVANAEAILSTRATLCYFGAEDYIADIGGVRTRSSVEVLMARSKVALAAHLGGVTALDQVVIDFRDEALFMEDAAVGRALGYRGKICIHPTQVPLANRCFTPTEDEVERSRRLLQAYEDAQAAGIGAIDFEGQMIDEPMVRRARRAIAVARVVAER